LGGNKSFFIFQGKKLYCFYLSQISGQLLPHSSMEIEIEFKPCLAENLNFNFEIDERVIVYPILGVIIEPNLDFNDFSLIFPNIKFFTKKDNNKISFLEKEKICYFDQIFQIIKCFHHFF
jgi:hypothetical protein